MSAPHGLPPGDVVAVVVITYNSGSVLPGLLESLPRGLEGVSWHLTIVDNASSDGTADLARRLAPEARIVQTGRNGGYAAGINAGVAAADPHTAVLVLNPDVRLMAGCGRELLRVLREPGTGIAVPRLVDGHGRLITTMRREPTLLRALGDVVLGARRAGRFGVLGEVVTNEQCYLRPTRTDWAEGSTLLISGECWRRCAPWDESFFLYSEETDFALRARDAGLVTRYTPSATAVHLEGESRTSPGLWALLTMNRLRLFARRHGPVATACYWAALLLREATRSLLGHAIARAAVRALLSPSRWRETPGPASVAPRAERHRSRPVAGA
jgi:N-acetylglucosaminyl-diphospho-decaprenol L-rhamnosyltransferase